MSDNIQLTRLIFSCEEAVLSGLIFLLGGLYGTLTPLPHTRQKTPTVLKAIRLKSPKNLAAGHLNINSLRNKFESSKSIISPTCDMLLVSKTKIYES